MIPKEEIRRIAEDALENRADIGERVLLDVWLEEDKALGKWFENEIEHTPASLSADVSERLHAGIFGKLKLQEVAYDSPNNIYMWKISTIVAVLALLTITGIHFIIPGKPLHTLPLSVSTGVGERSVVNLPDSSEINLNHLSRLDYVYDESKKERQLSLNGEATFDIATDAAHPFVVNCNGLRIECRGTSFNVNGYPDEKTVTVVLQEGAITAASSRQQIEMKPGTKVTFNTHSHSMTTSAVDAREYSEWVYGYERFSDEPLDVIARRLTRNYGTKIHLASPDISDIQLSGTLHANSIDEALSFISTATGLHYRKEKGGITIY